MDNRHVEMVCARLDMVCARQDMVYARGEKVYAHENMVYARGEMVFARVDSPKVDVDGCADVVEVVGNVAVGEDVEEAVVDMNLDVDILGLAVLD